LPERPVDLFVERRTAGRVLAERMILRSHQVRAVRERAADPLAIEPARFGECASKVGVRQRSSAVADDSDMPRLEIRGPRHERVVLQPTVSAADDWDRAADRLLNGPGQSEMPCDADQRM